MSGFRHIAVIGLGRIGGSLAAALKASVEFHYRIGGLDTKSKLTDQALREGTIDYAIDADLDDLRKADLVVLAAPVRAILTMIPVVRRHMAPGAVLLDVGSTKHDVIETMDATDAPVFCYGGHPVAAGARSASPLWNAALFAGSPFVIVRTISSTPPAEEMLRVLIQDIGGHMIISDADTHDRAVAITNQLPLLLANALVTLCARRADEADTTTLIDRAFEAATAAVREPPETVTDVLVTNRALIAEAYDALDGEMRRFLGLLHRDTDGVRRELTNARVARARFLPEEENDSAHRP